MELVNLSSNPKRKTKMSLEQTACEDLKAFERRLTEVIACLQPATNRWREKRHRLRRRGGDWSKAHRCLKKYDHAVDFHSLINVCIVLLLIVSVCTGIGAFTWLSDPETSAVSFTQSLWNHPFFTISAIILVLLCVMGIHKRVIAPSIITSRTRSVLSDFNMSCDDTGKLILRPRPTMT